MRCPSCRHLSRLGAVVVAVVALVLPGVLGKQVELKPGKSIKFYDELVQGAKWGTNFQLVEGTIGFKVRRAARACV